MLSRKELRDPPQRLQCAECPVLGFGCPFSDTGGGSGMQRQPKTDAMSPSILKMISLFRRRGVQGGWRFSQQPLAPSCQGGEPAHVRGLSRIYRPAAVLDSGGFGLLIRRRQEPVGLSCAAGPLKRRRVAWPDVRRDILRPYLCPYISPRSWGQFARGRQG